VHATDVGIQLIQKVEIGYLYLDRHAFMRRLRNKDAFGEPIMIKNFVMDTIKTKNNGLGILPKFLLQTSNILQKKFQRDGLSNGR